jgi:hypothetical protein
MRGVRGRGLKAIAFSVAAATATILAASSAHAASAKEIFEKYKLLGTFSYDCTKPADKKNLYFVNRALDADHVQRDIMSGPTTRDSVVIYDKVEELKSNEIRVSGTRDGEPAEGVFRIEQNRMLQWYSKVNGKENIRDGVFLATNYKLPYLNRCGN